MPGEGGLLATAQVMGTIDDATGDMAWHLEPLAGEGGEDIGWCEVMASCTGESCEAASLLGHDTLRRYKLGLGYWTVVSPARAIALRRAAPQVAPPHQGVNCTRRSGA